MSLSTSNLPSTNGLQAASPVSFNLQGTYGQQPQVSQSPPPASQSAPPGRQNTMPAVKTRADEENAKLAGLLANREEGIDTFGNFGALRLVILCTVVICAFIDLHTGTDSRRASTWRHSRPATTRSHTSSNSSSRARTSPSSRSRLDIHSTFSVPRCSRPRALALLLPLVPPSRQLYPFLSSSGICSALCETTDRLADCTR